MYLRQTRAALLRRVTGMSIKRCGKTVKCDNGEGKSRLHMADCMPFYYEWIQSRAGEDSTARGSFVFAHTLCMPSTRGGPETTKEEYDRQGDAYLIETKLFRIFAMREHAGQNVPDSRRLPSFRWSGESREIGILRFGSSSTAMLRPLPVCKPEI